MFEESLSFIIFRSDFLVVLIAIAAADTAVIFIAELHQLLSGCSHARVCHQHPLQLNGRVLRSRHWASTKSMAK
ncbi:hypothetical protein GOBAR_AA38364 [Gossypium barbadense]|uniref:Uncharacterized protein n=1 Tax=Gossypium barbadense TaxID=3634 RepID=A0A2P5RKW5_GOSBA|nr:hypothetical protein GOBAR_DD15602 [Gossypium barbadense]PPR82352.1 hypothetical protein GOBAR_AA38364 [Gossypium barbadense]